MKTLTIKILRLLIFDRNQLEININRQMLAGKVKVVPMLLTEHHAMKVYWRSGDIASYILDLGTRWR
jgi:hypothetical protein